MARAPLQRPWTSPAEPSPRRHQTCDFGERATSAPAELGGKINRALTQVLLQARRSHVYGGGTFRCLLYPLCALGPLLLPVDGVRDHLRGLLSHVVSQPGPTRNIYIYIYTYHIYTYIYIYIHIERERERDIRNTRTRGVRRDTDDRRVGISTAHLHRAPIVQVCLCLVWASLDKEGTCTVRAPTHGQTSRDLLNHIIVCSVHGGYFSQKGSLDIHVFLVQGFRHKVVKHTCGFGRYQINLPELRSAAGGLLTESSGIADDAVSAYCYC